MSASDDATGGRVLSWLHIGDLHLTAAGEENHRDLHRIVALANVLPSGSLDFALLPGDLADDGTADQYRLVRDAVAPLRLPLHVLPGDPLAGQIEEGPPGVSIAAVDGDCGSWRFKPLDRVWPFVLATRPVDRRLLVTANQTVGGPFVARAKVVGDAPVEAHRSRRPGRGAPVEAVEVQVDDGDWQPMTPRPGDPSLSEARCATQGGVRVRARDARGREDEDQVEPAPVGWTPPDRAADGSDRDRVGAWPAKGIFGTQLGPNRSGRKW